MFIYIETAKGTGRFNCRGVVGPSDDPHSLAFQMGLHGQKVYGSAKLVGSPGTAPRRARWGDEAGKENKGRPYPEEVAEEALVSGGAVKIEGRHSGGGTLTLP